jgi:hypothetical protein
MNKLARLTVGIAMIKPIIYRTIEEKELLEREMMAAIPPSKRELISRALMDIFRRSNKKASTSKSEINK